MTRNQKIALGCGGAGCLGLIVITVAASLVYFFYRQASYRASRDYDFNTNVNRNSNSADDSNLNSDSSNSNSESSASSVSDLSDDDKHRLFQAGAMTGDTELSQRVNVKIGLLNEDFTPTDDYQGFLGDHVTWVFQNTGFIRSINTPEKARAYVDEHLPQ